jgi:hypothetical protein
MAASISEETLISTEMSLCVERICVKEHYFATSALEINALGYYFVTFFTGPAPVL